MITLMTDRDMLLVVMGRLLERYPGKSILPRNERLVSADRWEIVIACECGKRRDLSDLPAYATHGDRPLAHCKREFFTVRNGDYESMLLAFVGQCESCGRVYLLHDANAIIDWAELSPSVNPWG